MRYAHLSPSARRAAAELLDEEPPGWRGEESTEMGHLMVRRAHLSPSARTVVAELLDEGREPPGCGADGGDGGRAILREDRSRG
jgi:hypothetical protein